MRIQNWKSYKNLFYGIIEALVLVSIISGCDPNPSSIGSSIGSSIAVSVVGSASSGKNINADQKLLHIEPMTDETYFKEERKTANRGSLVSPFTPEEFVLDLDYLRLYKKIGEEYQILELLKYITNPVGNIIPRHINIIYANSFIRNVAIDGD